MKIITNCSFFSYSILLLPKLFYCHHIISSNPLIHLVIILLLFTVKFYLNHLCIFCIFFLIFFLLPNGTIYLLLTNDAQSLRCVGLTIFFPGSKQSLYYRQANSSKDCWERGEEPPSILSYRDFYPLKMGGVPMWAPER